MDPIFPALCFSNLNVFGLQSSLDKKGVGGEKLLKK